MKNFILLTFWSLVFFFFFWGGAREKIIDKIIGWFHFCNSFNFQENTQQVNENFRKKNLYRFTEISTKISAESFLYREVASYR